MKHRICTIDGCGKKHYCRGMCRAHHSRARRAEGLARTDKPCLIDGCTAAGTAGRGWCEKHYRRYLRHGDPLSTSRVVGDDDARFWFYVDLHGPNGCWNWTGSTSPDGYGVLRIKGTTCYMPRYSWEKANGPMGEGLEPDHLCRNRSCVNPDHLEPVTHKVNILRGESPAAINARKTHCKRGHEFTPGNTYIQRVGGRVCRACAAEWERVSRRKAA